MTKINKNETKYLKETLLNKKKEKKKEKEFFSFRVKRFNR
jgi:hypothetical protein